MSSKAAKNVTKLRDVVDVVADYGADPTGVADSTSAIQAAATAAAGKRLYIPAGTYLISTVITLLSGTEVIGDGQYTIIKLSTGDMSAFYATGKTAITVRDLRIYCTVVGTTAMVGGVYLLNCTNCLVENVEGIGVSWAGVLLSSTNYSTIKGCRFSGFLGSIANSNDVYLIGTSSWNTVDGNFCYGGGSGCGVAVQDYDGASLPVGNTIVNNHVGAHGAYGIMAYLSFVPSADMLVIISGNNIKDITGVNPSGAGGCGVYIQGVGGAVVTNNTISNCCISNSSLTLAPAGIGVINVNLLADTVTLATPPVISGNIISKMPKLHGIQIASCASGANVSGNSININTSDGRGIYVNNSPLTVVNGNIVKQAGATDGILIQAPSASLDRITVTNNDVVSGGVGIRYAQSGAYTFNRPILSGNNVAATGIGLQIAYHVNGQVSGNNVTSATYPLYYVTNTYTRLSGNSFVTTGGASYGVLTSGTCTGSIFTETNYINNLMTNNATAFLVSQFGSAAPMLSGTWGIGDRVIQSVPVVGNPKGWRCTVAGNPGTWVSEGNL